jgi:hypothetical protein
MRIGLNVALNELRARFSNRATTEQKPGCRKSVEVKLRHLFTMTRKFAPARGTLCATALHRTQFRRRNLLSGFLAMVRTQLPRFRQMQRQCRVQARNRLLFRDMLSLLSCAKD